MNGAHNAGGYEAMQQAASDGIILDKQWLATHDERTRDSHAHLDGETVHYNEKFSNGLRYPQDPQGEAAEVYNCRCAMREITRGFYNKYTGKTVMLPDAPQDEYAAESKAYWNKYFAEKKNTEAELAAAENPNYSNKLLKNDTENGIIYRKESNTGDFSIFEEPMQKRHIENIINDMDVDFTGINVKINRDNELINQDVFGYTYPDGKTIVLYPKAFKNREQLVKTLGHEYTHHNQIINYGKVSNTEISMAFDKEAYSAENEYWEKYRRKTGYGKSD